MSGCARNDRITRDFVSCDPVVPGAATHRSDQVTKVIMCIYRQDRHADKNPYRHDRRADKNPYRHDRRADSQCHNAHIRLG